LVNALRFRGWEGGAARRPAAHFSDFQKDNLNPVGQYSVNLIGGVPMSFKHCLAVAMVFFSPVLAVAEPGPMRGACMGDIKALCGSIQPGGGRIRDCMKEHRAQLSDKCKLAIADRMLERHPVNSPVPRPQ
jgi:hypothetical protein